MASLTPYQIEDHAKIDSFGGKAILAWDMGLGKTCEAVTYVAERELFPCIIACPMSAKSVMLPELRKFIGKGHLITINNGKVCDIPKLDQMYILINYDLLHKWEDKLKETNYKSLVFDEAHTLSNVDTKKNRSVRRLSQDTKHILFLTGTPFKNTEEEMFTMLNIMNPHMFTAPEDITHMVEGGYFNEVLTRNFMIRRLKTVELKDLPPKTRHVVNMTLSNQWEYEFAERDFKNWLDQQESELTNQKKICAFAKLEKLKQIAIAGKVHSVSNWIENRLQSEGKTLVFFTHTKPLIGVYERFSEEAVMIKGGMTQRQREKVIQEFMTNPRKRLLLGNVKAAGTSLTLIQADTVFMAEMPWTSVDCDQCEDRVWRIGQENEVNAYYGIAKGTVDERIARIVDRKREKLSQSIDGVGVKAKEVLMELINDYRSDYAY